METENCFLSPDCCCFNSHLVVAARFAQELRLTDHLILAFLFVPWTSFYQLWYNSFSTAGAQLNLAKHWNSHRFEKFKFVVHWFSLPPWNLLVRAFLLILGGANFSETKFTIGKYLASHFFHPRAILFSTWQHRHTVWSTRWSRWWAPPFCSSSTTLSSSPAASQKNCAQRQQDKGKSEESFFQPIFPMDVIIKTGPSGEFTGSKNSIGGRRAPSLGGGGCAKFDIFWCDIDMGIPHICR